MPSSGKSIVGAELAYLMGRELVDTDNLIVEKIQMPIAEYFKTHTEQQFRDVESEIIKEISSKNGIIIATGGGAILNQDNIRRLKQNGKIYFLDRNLENLIPTNDRPLSSDIDALKKRYEERYPIYKTSCDVAIDGNGTVEQVAEKIFKEWQK
jgi:shikimate dehydrogenase